MYIHCSLLFVALIISWLARASCSTNTSYNLLWDQQTKSCPSDGMPVCGLRDKQLVLFPNGCLFSAENWSRWPNKPTFRRIPLQNCMQGCKFSCLKTYKPVCTRNHQTNRRHLFRNQCELTKRICKQNVEYHKISLYECIPKTQQKNLIKTVNKRAESSKKRRIPVPCTNVFKPVCGSYLGVKSSFKNECLLNAENVAFNRDWRIVKNGMCPEDFSKTRRRKDQPAKHHSIEQRSLKNKLLKQYLTQADHQGHTDNKNDLPTFNDKFLNRDTSIPHPFFTEPEVYKEYLEKIEDFRQTEETDKPYCESEKYIVNPLPFAGYRPNLNDLTNKSLAHEINQQYGSLNTSKMFNKPKQIKKKEISKPKIECKFGSVAVCATLTNGTTRTFKTVCEMMTENVNLKKIWTRLHNGPCENCKYNCSRDYQPVCISRNGVNYTMVNECYYNMGICMDKRSNWQMLSNKECDRYTRIPDEYSYLKKEFRQTSSDYAGQKLSADSKLEANSGKTNINKKRKGNTKREISRPRVSDECCSRTNLSNKFSKDILNCKCWSDSTQEPFSRLLPQESQTESYIMGLVKEK